MHASQIESMPAGSERRLVTYKDLLLGKFQVRITKLFLSMILILWKLFLIMKRMMNLCPNLKLKWFYLKKLGIRSGKDGKLR